ncbi:MFS transporter [Gephyromycinifex aptenodytis]|uniref:MFS transporter n=1 Tax=Gephyromycinifex aptenodytis TaxID=2716227 RepID=UPI001D026E0B|nr:MFS transporter [Gephyromycinifex aptenodytis]
MLDVPGVRLVLALGLLVRIPIFASSILLTLHVVSALGRSYQGAGLVAGCATVALAISGPWRGRLLDRLGLRRVVLPSLLITGVCWSIAPFMSYWPLLGLATLAGLFAVPVFPITRQALLVLVPDESRRAALSLDSVCVEMAYIIGPLLAVWLSTSWPTSWALLTLQLAGVGAGAVLWFLNPPLRSRPSDPQLGSAAATAACAVGASMAEPARAAGTIADPGAAAGSARWFTPRLFLVCAAAACTTFVVVGAEIAMIAAMRGFGAQSALGLVLAASGAGSLIGGLFYGAQGRAVPSLWLLGGLACINLPLAMASGPYSLTAFSFFAGLLCAPTITATVDEMARIVPERVRGEAMGWHGSFLTSGSAAGAPAIGAAIDIAGPAAGFLTAGGVGLALALGGGAFIHLRRRRLRKIRARLVA